MFIASNTSGSDDNLGYCSIELNVGLARKLLDYRPVYELAHRHDNSLYALEFFNYLAEFGTSDLDIADDWVEVPDEAVQPERSDANMMKVTSSGVIWTCTPKYSEVYTEIESEELSWEILEAVSAGKNPFRKVNS